MSTVDLPQHIQSNTYLSQRLDPKPGDNSYLILSDLRLAVGQVAADQAWKILDYGCGGSPYRSLFPNADYRRADYLQNPGDLLDYTLDENSRVQEESATFDFVLSTQVIEHVQNPVTYLQECHRLLKKGGKLYLTTHGSYPDHPCPADLYRWTLDGLVSDLRHAGFEIVRAEKITTGPRAFFQQADYQFRTLFASKRSLFGLLLAAFRATYSKTRPWLHRMCDEHFGENRVVIQRLDEHVYYKAIGCLATKI